MQTNKKRTKEAEQVLIAVNSIFLGAITAKPKKREKQASIKGEKRNEGKEMTKNKDWEPKKQNVEPLLEVY